MTDAFIPCTACLGRGYHLMPGPCAHCGGDRFILLGMLGHLTNLRCQHCGAEHSCTASAATTVDCPACDGTGTVPAPTEDRP